MSKTIGIIGASADRRKFGNKAVRAFVQAGWTVYPVNPKEKSIEGLPCRASASELPEGLDRVSMYVRPETGLQMLDAIAATSPETLFLNPGSESPELAARAEALGLKVVQACSIVDIGMRPEMFSDA